MLNREKIMYKHTAFEFGYGTALYHVREERIAGKPYAVTLGITAVKFADVHEADITPVMPPRGHDELLRGTSGGSSVEELERTGLALWADILNGRLIAEPPRLSLAQMIGLPPDVDPQSVSGSYSSESIQAVRALGEFVAHTATPHEQVAMRRICEQMPYTLDTDISGS
jgi:hypothetical protein